MPHRRFGTLLTVVAASILLAAATPALASSSKSAEPQLISDASLKAMYTTVGGADVLPTTRTIPHWWGSTTDPTNGVTYGYNMVGADPNNCSGAGCSVTIQADITPINVTVDGFPGYEFNGTDILQGTLDSPQFALNDYGSTSAATNSGFAMGAGGALSQDDAGNLLQLQDATMRAQFNQTGSSNYHVILHPNVMPAVNITVPRNQATLLASGRGVIFADVNISWWAARIQNLEQSANPTHLAIYMTNNVMNYIGSPGNCCVIGFHGTRAAGNGDGSTNSKGNAKVQTFAWASWVQPGLYSRPNGGVYWALQDIHPLSHEIAEWADDPFVNNYVNPWVTPTAPQYGCTGILETGDPVVAIGFAMGTNTTDQVANPWTSPNDHTPSISYDGKYHPEDEALLPWFMRTSPNDVSEPTQSASTNVGRYTFMGDLNPFPGFREPATGCS